MKRPLDYPVQLHLRLDKSHLLFNLTKIEGEKQRREEGERRGRGKEREREVTSIPWSAGKFVEFTQMSQVRLKLILVSKSTCGFDRSDGHPVVCSGS